VINWFIQPTTTHKQRWPIQDFVKGANYILPLHPLLFLFPIPSSSSLPTFPLFFHSNPSHFPSFPPSFPEGLGQRVSPPKLLKFNMEFGAFWSILEMNLRLSSLNLYVRNVSAEGETITGCSPLKYATDKHTHTHTYTHIGFYIQCTRNYMLISRRIKACFASYKS